MDVITIEHATMEQKLKLLQQIRSRYNENQYDMSNRERILYGKTSGYPSESFPDPELEPPQQYYALFKVRLLLALLLFGAVIAMDAGGFQIGEFNAGKVFEMISADYEDQLDEWVEAMTDKPQE